MGALLSTEAVTTTAAYLTEKRVNLFKIHDLVSDLSHFYPIAVAYVNGGHAMRGLKINDLRLNCPFSDTFRFTL